MERLRARKQQLQDELREIERIESDLERTIEEALRTIGAGARGAVSGARKAVKAERSRPATLRKAATRRPSAAKTSGSGKRGRPKGTGKRQAQAVKIIKATPGIRTSEVAKKMGIGPNYLYRLLPELAAAGLIVKSGKGWSVPAASA
jgi:hypothetical protein